jgi:hypothetical protein
MMFVAFLVGNICSAFRSDSLKIHISEEKRIQVENRLQTNEAKKKKNHINKRKMFLNFNLKTRHQE